MRKLAPNINTLNALVLWGILSPKQLSFLLGVSVSYCSKELKKLVRMGLAQDIGRTCLDPLDPLYGRYYLLSRSGKLARFTDATSNFRLRVGSRLGADKVVKFSSGVMAPRHYLFSSLAAFWVVDFISRRDPEHPAICFPESYLRVKLGWHRGLGPRKNVPNPRLTMVPDALIVYRKVEIRIEAEITPKSKQAYRSSFDQLRPNDDTVIYVYPSRSSMLQVSPKLPRGYRLGEVVFGDEDALRDVFKRQILSLFAR